MKVNDKSTRLPWGRARKPTAPFQRDEKKKADDQSFYNTAAWRKLAKQEKIDQPYCEVTKALTGRLVLADVTDHLIRWQEGGAKLDRRNLMNMTRQWHDRKSGMEKHNAILIKTIEVDGELLPADRNEIFEILKKD